MIRAQDRMPDTDRYLHKRSRPEAETSYVNKRPVSGMRSEWHEYHN